MALTDSSSGDNTWLHILVLIPIEFGILHSTLLGPMLTEGFASLWTSIGLESIVHTHEAGGHVHAFTEAATNSSSALDIPCTPDHPSFHYELDGSPHCGAHGSLNSAPTIDWG